MFHRERRQRAATDQAEERPAGPGRTFRQPGRSLCLFSEDVSPGPFFQYNKNPYDVIYAIKRLDRQNGEIQAIVATSGGAVRPSLRPTASRWPSSSACARNRCCMSWIWTAAW
jgi:hypothetical protein